MSHIRLTAALSFGATLMLLLLCTAFALLGESAQAAPTDSPVQVAAVALAQRPPPPVPLPPSSLTRAELEAAGGNPSDWPPAPDFVNAESDPNAPRLTVTKTVGTQPNVCAATTALTITQPTDVQYCFIITLQGDVTVTQHEIYDPVLAYFVEWPYTLSAEQTPLWTLFPEMVTITRTTVNTVTWRARNDDGSTDLIDDGAAIVSRPPPALDVTKTVSTDPAVCGISSSIQVAPGTKVYYCYQVRNTGGYALENHTLTDELKGTVLENYAFDLEPGETFNTVDAGFVIEETARESRSSAGTWRALSPEQGGGNSVQASDTASIIVVPSAIGVRATTGRTPACTSGQTLDIAPGELVYFCYEVTNQGLTELETHTVRDDQGGLVLEERAISVSPGASVQIVRDAVLQQSLENTVTWTAYTAAENGERESASASDRVQINVAAVVLRHGVDPSANPPSLCNDAELTTTVGTPVRFCLALENTGGVPLMQHAIDVPAVGLKGSFEYELAPGETLLLDNDTLASLGLPRAFEPIPAQGDIESRAVYTATQPVADPGVPDIVVTASARARVRTPSIVLDVLAAPVSAGAPCEVGGETLVVEAGTVVAYCYRVTNTGQVPLPQHTIFDSVLGTLQRNEPFTLAPASQGLFTTTTAVSETQIATATWTAFEPGGARAIATASRAVLVPSIALTETVSLEPTPCGSAQSLRLEQVQSVYHCFTLQNTGPLPLDVHALQHNTLGKIELGALPLAPGETLDTVAAGFTFTTSITQSVETNALWTALTEVSTGPTGNPIAPVRALGRDGVRIEFAPPAGTLRVAIYYDVNGNGQQDSAEPGLADVPVQIVPTDVRAGGGRVLNTNASGVIEADDVAIGEYGLLLPNPLLIAGTGAITVEVTPARERVGPVTIDEGQAQAVTIRYQGAASTDSDGDGIPDLVEGAADRNGNQIPDYLDALSASAGATYLPLVTR